MTRVALRGASVANSSSGPSGSGDETKLARYIVGKIFDLVLKVLESRNILAALVAFTVCFVTWVALLPADQRINANPAAIAEGLAHLLGHGLFAFGGWLTSLLLLSIGVPMFYLQHKRIQNQGALNIKLREDQQPGRLSASNPDALHNYPAESAKRFNLPQPPDPKKK